MSTNFDERIRSVLADARSQAPAPVEWSDVVERTTAPASTARPRFGRVLVAAAAGLVIVLVAGLAVIAQRDSDVDSPSLTATEPLAQIEPGEAALPTVVPEGWSIEPLINDGQLTWNFVDPATGRTGGVSVGGPLDSAPTQEVIDVAGTEWERLESVTSYRAGFEMGSVVVYAPGFGFDEIEPLLAGLRPGAPGEHPGGVFDPRSDGDVIVSTDRGTLRAAVVNERVCWGFFNLDEIRTTGCSLDPLATPAPSKVSVDGGIAVLMQFGIGTSIENERNDTVIGVTTTDIAGVELEFTDGATITVPASDPTDALGVRFFVGDKLTVQTDDSMSLVAVTAAGLDDEPTLSPDDVGWLSTMSPLDGLRLTSATRDLAVDCPPNASCTGPGTIPVATLSFGTDDLTASRTLNITQFFDDSTFQVIERTTDGEQRVIGSRSVTISEQGTPEAPFITAGWDEPGGFAVELSASGLSLDTVEALIGSLEPTEPSGWPVLEVQEPLTPCVDAGTQYAPATVPPGWNRFVLEAQPTGTCNVTTVLFMSLVEPGTEQEPGALVTFVSAAASTTTPQPGQAIEINGHPAVIQESTGDDGNASTVIYLTIGDVVVDGHGNVDRDTLEALMASITAFDDEQWAQLVNEIDNE